MGTTPKASTLSGTPRRTCWPRRSEALYPGIKFGIGPAIENGFYYDVDSPVPITEADLETIEKKMIELAQQGATHPHGSIESRRAEEFHRKGDPYKVELIRDLEDGTISFYTNGAFTDLCRGPHLAQHGVDQGAIALTHVGEPEKVLLQRIREEQLPCVLCINKIDTVEKKEALLEVIAAYSAAYDGFDAIIPISARTGDGLDELMRQLSQYAQEGPSCSPTA